MVVETLESLSEEQIGQLTNEQIGDRVLMCEVGIRHYFPKNRKTYEKYFHELRKYWNELHRRNPH